MLKEDHKYDFKVIRLVNLPDNSKFWLLTHSGKDRYLFPLKYYHDYNIQEGCVISCLVDKINCTGKIYLEPEHPFYQAGIVYTFRFIKDFNIVDAAGNIIKSVLLAGKAGDEHIMYCYPFEFSFTLNDPVKVLVNRIRKGKLHLSFCSPDIFIPFVEGGRYDFAVTAETKTSIGDCYIIENDNGIKSFLEKEFYRDHGLKRGQTFSGLFRKWQPDSYPLIEPEHPYYKIDSIYDFPVCKVERSSQQETPGMYIYVVKDIFENEIKVFSGIKDLDDQLPQPSIKCKVERLKKGKPVLRSTT